LRNYIVNGVRHTAYTAAHLSTNTDSGFGNGKKSTHISVREFSRPQILHSQIYSAVRLANSLDALQRGTDEVN
jgi:hypothetical protein